jgi:hypothetical protein
MGLHPAEEMHDVYDTRATESGMFEVVDLPEVMESVDEATGEIVTEG